MHKRRKGKHSLFKKIIIPLIGVLLFQSVFFFAATFYGGVSSLIDRNAEDVLTERVINQNRSLQTLFTTQWANFSSATTQIDKIYHKVMKDSYKDLYESEELQKKVLEETKDVLINMLRSNEVTGTFLILNNSKNFEPRQNGEVQEKYGVCIRDYSPTSDYTKNEDLLVVRCPASMISTIGCSMETWWNPKFVFDDKINGDFFYQPLKLAYENPKADNMDLAYFDSAHNFGQTDRMVVSYSIPLVDEEGYPYGVVGVELTTDYLKTLIPSSTLYPDNASCYAIVQYQEGDNHFQVQAYNGVLYQQCFGDETSFDASWYGNNILKNIESKTNVGLVGSLGNFQVYNPNTPFEKNKLALVGIVKMDVLYKMKVRVCRSILMVSLVGLLVGCVLVLFASKHLTAPINRLSRKVRQMDGDSELELERLNIDEIDDLVESIEDLNEKIYKTAIRTEFFSRMSHDMRTPMNAIIGFSSPEILENADLDVMRDYMDKIHSSGNFLLTLINEVLDMTKIETQRMELREEPVTDLEILDSIVPIIQEVANEKNIDFSFKNNGLTTAFYGDRQRISQILMNFLSNAVKYTPPYGKVTMTIDKYGKTDTTICSHVVIQDTGCGMSEEFQQKMYEPFSQENPSAGGTGLGLAIANQMITLMGGTLKCYSAVGKGTTFEIEFVHRLADPNEVVKPAEKLDAKKNLVQGDLSGNRILLCEDHPLNAQIATKILERFGLEVELAEDGQKGLDLFRASKEYYYDLILMDIRMPNKNGLDCAREIRALERKDAKDITIIAMTANAFKEDVDDSRRAGMNEHLSKPIDPKILYVTLKKYLQKK